MPLEVPVRSLHATHPDTLVGEWNTWMEALRLSLEFARRCSPHGRDYSANGLSAAQKQHAKWMASIETTLIEVEEMAIQYITRG